MVRSRIVLVPVFAASVLAVAGGQGAAVPNRLDDAGLKATLSKLGYEVKEPGAKTYEIALAAAGLKIPTRVFLAKSRTKLWFSVALMQKAGVDKLTRDDLARILAANTDVGPCHFMIDGGWLKMKMALDNRGLTPAILRTELDYLAARVGESKAVWQK